MRALPKRVASLIARKPHVTNPGRAMIGPELQVLARAPRDVPIQDVVARLGVQPARAGRHFPVPGERNRLAFWALSCRSGMSVFTVTFGGGKRTYPRTLAFRRC